MPIHRLLNKFDFKEFWQLAMYGLTLLHVKEF